MSAVKPQNSRSMFVEADPWVRPSAAVTVDEAQRRWQHIGGPKPGAWLLTQPGDSPKARKSTRPEYLLHLMPHRLVQGQVVPKVNLCIWSTKGCRKHCLVHAGRGGAPGVIKGRMARTVLAVEYPQEFVVLLHRDLQRIKARDKKNGTRSWVRLNATSDIAYEDTRVRTIMSDSGLMFADYTKATPDQRPEPFVRHYTLARSVWPGRDSVTEAVALMRSGHHVSMVVDDLTPLRQLEDTMAGWYWVEADKTDEWMLNPEPIIGVLTPKGSLKNDPDQVFSGAALAEALAEAWDVMIERKAS